MTAPHPVPGIRTEQVRLIYDRGRELVLGAALAATVTMLATWWWRDGPFPWPWLAALAVQALARLALIDAWRRARPADADVPRWGLRFSCGTLVAGLVWCGWGLSRYDPADLEFLLLLSTVYAGLIAVSATSAGVHAPSFLSFSVPLALPLSAWHVASGRDELVATGAMLVIFLGVNVVLARRVSAHHAMLTRALRDNAELADRLVGEKRVAEAAVVAKSRFLAAASHDLRQPLHALGLFVATLRGRSLGTQETELVENVSSCTDALKGLFDALLDLSRLDAGTVEPEPVHVRLDDVLDRLRARFAPHAHDKGLELTVAPSAIVAWADPILLERALGNLVENAVRYTARGGVRLEVDPAPGGACRIVLSDTGIGIPAASTEEVFGEYVQLGNPSRDREAGLGLGLSIVRRLCALMDVPLAMDSTPGIGTRFELLVPGGDPARVASAPEAPAPVACDGALVLVVDDEAPVLEATGLLLESRGCTALLAGSAREAMRAVALAGRAPDLVLSDLRLGAGASGIDAVRALREATAPGLAALIVTGDTCPERLREIRESGLEALCKPVSAGALDAVLARLAVSGPVADAATPAAAAVQDVARTSLPTVSPCTRIDSSTIT